RGALARIGHETAADMEAVAAADVVLDCAGAPEILGRGLEILAPRGLYVAVGYGLVPSLDLAPVARKELTIRGIRSGSQSDLEDALELAAAGEIRLPRVSTWSIEDINAAFRALRRGEVEGK